MDAERDSSRVYFLSCTVETTAPFTRRRTRNYYTEWYVIFAFLCRARQPLRKLTQIISQWFYTPDLSNQTFQREIPGRFGICFTPPGPGGRSRDCVCTCVYLTSGPWTRTRNRPQERQMIFSHGQLCMTPLRHKEVLEQTVYCTLSQVMCLTNGTAFWRLPYMLRSLWIPWEARN